MHAGAAGGRGHGGEGWGHSGHGGQAQGQAGEGIMQCSPCMDQLLQPCIVQCSPCMDQLLAMRAGQNCAYIDVGSSSHSSIDGSPFLLMPADLSASLCLSVCCLPHSTSVFALTAASLVACMRAASPTALPCAPHPTSTPHATMPLLLACLHTASTASPCPTPRAYVPSSTPCRVCGSQARSWWSGWRGRPRVHVQGGRGEAGSRT